MQTPIIITLPIEKGKIIITQKELLKILDTVYKKGYDEGKEEAGKNVPIYVPYQPYVPYYPSPVTTPYYPTITWSTSTSSDLGDMTTSSDLGDTTSSCGDEWITLNGATTTAKE